MPCKDIRAFLPTQTATRFGCATRFSSPHNLRHILKKPYNQLFYPHNMPKSLEFDADRLAEACKAALAQKKPNIAKIAREFNVSRTSLSSRVKKAKTPTTPTQSGRNALLPYQEKALVNWIVKMHS